MDGMAETVFVQDVPVTLTLTAEISNHGPNDSVAVEGMSHGVVG